MATISLAVYMTVAAAIAWRCARRHVDDLDGNLRLLHLLLEALPWNRQNKDSQTTDRGSVPSAEDSRRPAENDD